MAKSKGKQYIYIVQASLEPSKCKIGKTNDLERRLKEYNNITGVSKENKYQYLFTCEVKNMAQVESDIKNQFPNLREEKSKEIYFYNSGLFDDYVKFIKLHKMFVVETYIKPKNKREIIKIVKRTAPTLEERGISYQNLIKKAQKSDNDEFYTRFEDVEKELSMYNKSIWKNKTVFCNCDDAVDDDSKNTSAFALYFLQNFVSLELKKLICTHYADTQLDLFNQGSRGYVFTKYGYREIDFNKEYPRGYNGSFDDPLSLQILKEEADIVCTNPPFSRAIDYWKTIIESGKKFIIISNVTNVITQAFTPYFAEKKVWAGFNEISWFLTPKKQLTRAAGYWYTNIPIKNRPKHKLLKIIPLKEIPDKYKKYDDTKTLLVDNSYIPSDYKKAFAVSSRSILNGLLEKGFKIIQNTQYIPYIKGKAVFARVLVKKWEKNRISHL